MASSPDNFFRYTSRRWLHEEDQNKALRYQPFNIDALKDEIIHITGASGVVDMTKLGEGLCNKAFEVQLSDGRSVVARIPTPMAGRQHLVTASEVATMKFLRDRLGLTQIPRIISWSSQAEDTPVGAEYIVMEKADGVQLAAVWETLTPQQQLNVVIEWTRFERKVVGAFSKGGFGSLYLRKDIPSDAALDIFLTDSNQPELDYVLGPSVFRRGYWEERYGVPKDLNLDCGPWTDVASYIKSLTNSERAWIRKYAQPPARNRTYVAPWELPAHLQSPKAHLHALDLYDEVAPYLIPKLDQLSRPTMTLVDSNACNIFLSEDALSRDGSIVISGVIDWQHTTVLPLFFTAITPTFITDATPGEGQDEAKWEKVHAYFHKTYHAMYFDTGIDTVWAEALCYDLPPPAAKTMPIAAQACWHAGYADLKLNLIRLALYWEKLAPGTKCPIAGEGFTAQDLERAREDCASWDAACLELEDLQRRIGVAEDNSVYHAKYDSVKQKNYDLFRAWKAGLDFQTLNNDNPVDIWPIGRDALREMEDSTPCRLVA